MTKLHFGGASSAPLSPSPLTHSPGTSTPTTVAPTTLSPPTSPPTPSPTLPYGWRMYMSESEFHLLCWLTIGFAAFSLIVSIIVLRFYVRYRPATRTVVMDVLAFTFVLAIPSSVNFIVSASLLLAHEKTAEEYCDFSGFGIGVFIVPQVMMEGLFFGCVAWARKVGAPSLVMVRKLMVICVIIGALMGVIPFGALNANPHTGSTYSYIMPWCWLPDRVSEGNSQQTLLTLKWVCGMMWPVFTIVLGTFTFTYVVIFFKYVRRKPIHRTIYFRLFYFVVFAVVWITLLVQRMQDRSDANLRRFVAIFEPGLAGINGILFLLMLGYKGIRRRYKHISFENDVEIHPEDRERMRHDSHFPIHRTFRQSLHTRASGIYSPRNASPRNAPSFAVGEAGYTFVDDLVEAMRRTGSVAFHPDFLKPELRFDETVSEYILVGPDGKEQEERLEVLRQSIIPGSLIRKITHIEKPPFGLVMSLIGGYCDGCTFVNVGIMASHITGNAVLMAATIGNSKDVQIQAILPKLIALPVFFFSVSFSYSLHGVVRQHRRILLLIEGILLFSSFVVAHFTGPFMPNNKYSLGAYFSGMLMVSAMGIQNSYQRTHLVGLPTTTTVTANLTQVAQDCVDILKNAAKGNRQGINERIANMKLFGGNAFMFLTGAMCAAVVSRYWNMWAYVPPILALACVVTLFWEETYTPPKELPVPQSVSESSSEDGESVVVDTQGSSLST